MVRLHPDVETELIFSLAATGEQATTRVVIEGGAQEASIPFEGLSSATLELVGAGPTTAPPVVTVPSEPLTGGDLWAVVLLAVIPAMILLAMMVARSPVGGDASVNQSFRSQVEGMVLVMVVVAVVLLGVTDKIGSDGLVSVLAAIVGYTVGRQVSDRRNGDHGAGGDQGGGGGGGPEEAGGGGGDQGGADLGAQAAEAEALAQAADAEALAQAADAEALAQAQAAAEAQKAEAEAANGEAKEAEARAIEAEAQARATEAETREVQGRAARGKGQRETGTRTSEPD